MTTDCWFRPGFAVPFLPDDRGATRSGRGDAPETRLAYSPCVTRVVRDPGTIGLARTWRVGLFAPSRCLSRGSTPESMDASRAPT